MFRLGLTRATINGNENGNLNGNGNLNWDSSTVTTMNYALCTK